MFERKNQPLLPLSKFLIRLAYGVGFGIICVIIGLGVGMWGYHSFEHMPWPDAFVNAAMILSGMGPVGTLSTKAGKVFAGCYALFSGLAFILIMSLVFAPILHRFFHKFHLDTDVSVR